MFCLSFCLSYVSYVLEFVLVHSIITIEGKGTEKKYWNINKI